MFDVVSERQVVELKAPTADPQVVELLTRLAEQNREIIGRLDRQEKAKARPPQQWFSPAEIVTIFGLKNKRLVLDAAKSGELPAANIARGEQPKYVINIDDATTWMRAKMAKRTGDTKDGRQQLVNQFFGPKKKRPAKAA